jgi:hypothetical protein
VVVFAVRAQVAGQFVDPLGEQGDLDLGGTGVAIGSAVFADQLVLLLFGEAHIVKTPCTPGVTAAGS